MAQPVERLYEFWAETDRYDQVRAEPAPVIDVLRQATGPGPAHREDRSLRSFNPSSRCLVATHRGSRVTKGHPW